METVPGVTTEVRGSSVTVLWDENGIGFSLDDCDKELRAGDPRIEVMRKNRPSTVAGVTDDAFPKSVDLANNSPDRLQVVCMPLQSGEDLIIGKRLRETLGAAHARSPDHRNGFQLQSADPVRFEAHILARRFVCAARFKEDMVEGCQEPGGIEDAGCYFL